MKNCKNVNLFIDLLQSLAGKDSQSSWVYTNGVLKRRKDKWVLEYENEYNGMSKMTLFDTGCVDIVSNGDILYNLKLDKDKKTKFMCKTNDTFSYFSVKTRDIFIDINDVGGNVRLDYGLEIDDNVGDVLNSRLNILVK